MNKWLLRLSKTRSRQGLYEFLNKEFATILRGYEVLTIGSGGAVNQLLGKYSSAQGFNVQSFDIDPERGPDILGDICSYQFDKTYDVVVLSEVLEHLHSPHLGIENIRKALKPGGRLILTTPFIFPLHDHPHDYYRFTKYGITFLLKDFDNVQVQERNGYFEAIDVLYMRVLMQKSQHTSSVSWILLPFIFYVKRPITKFLDWYCKMDGLTTGYNVTAAKKQTDS